MSDGSINNTSSGNSVPVTPETSAFIHGQNLSHKDAMKLLGQLASTLPSAQQTSAQGPSTQDMEQALVQIAKAISTIEVLVAQSSQFRSQSDISIAQKGIETAKASLANASEQLKKIQESSHRSWWQKLVDAVVDVVVVVIAFCAAGPLGAALALALIVATQTGLMQKGIDALAKEVGSKALAEALVFVACAALTFGVGEADEAMAGAAEVAESAVTTTAESATEVATTTAEETVEETAQVASKDVTPAVKNISNKAAKLGKILAKYAPAMQASNITDAMAQGLTDVLPIPKKDKEYLELALTVLITLLTLMSGLGAGSEGEDASTGKKILSGLKKLAKPGSQMSKIVDSLPTLGNWINKSGQAAEIGSQGYQSYKDFQVAAATLALAIAESGIMMGQSISDQADSMAKSEQKSGSEALKRITNLSQELAQTVYNFGSGASSALNSL